MAANTEELDLTLSKLFDDGLELYNNLGKINEPTNSPEVQSNVKAAIELFEKATRLVSIADIFSANESIEEVSTNNLKYLLLPALLGSLTLKRTSGSRLDIVGCADVYYKDFLKRCNQYGLSNYKFKNEEPDDASEPGQSAPKSELEVIESQINTRATKIQKYKEQKELQAKLETLKQQVANEHCDEEIKRDYFLSLLNLFVLEATDEMNSLETERDILKHMAQINMGEKPKKGPQPKPLKPVIITRDNVQKAIYGAGYPSLPTLTVEEFYEQRVKEGIFPDPNKQNTMSLQDATMAGLSIKDEEQESAELERRIENDDPEMLENLRRQDEFKDEHRRGWGNRMNRS